MVLVDSGSVLCSLTVNASMGGRVCESGGGGYEVSKGVT